MMFRGLVATWPGRLVALVIIGAIAGGAAMVARANSPAPSAPPRTATVTRGSITQTVSVSGSVNAFGQTRLAFRSGGKLAQVSVSVGQSVTAGQALASLDTTDLQSALATAQQNLANAQASYAKQVLAGSDARAALADAQKSTATSVTNAQNALAKLTSSYASAKVNYGSLTDGATNDLLSYRSAIDALRTEEQLVASEISSWVGGDITNARNSLYSADASLTTAQSFSADTLGTAMGDFTNARGALLVAMRGFDAAYGAGGDTNASVAAYQTAQLSYAVALARLQGAIDTVSGMVSGAQSSASAAASSLNTTASKTNANLDQARADSLVLQNLFVTDAQLSATAKTRLAQSATPLATMTDAVGGSLVNATTAVTTAQDQAATTLRNAQSAVSNIPYNLQAAAVSVQNAQTALDTAKTNLDAATLVAPTAGVVSSIANQAGEYVGGGNAASAFIVLTNTATMVLHGTIGEADIAKLKLGQVANVTVDALTGAKMTGKVTSLDPVATISQGVPVYGVDVTIDVPAPAVKAGMTGTASVILASKQGVLLIPNTAIRTVNGQRAVQVLKGTVATDAQVQLGLSNDTSTEVTSGLAEGDTIVIPTRTGAPSQQNRGFGGAGGGGPTIIGR